tara:strand:- start:172 stop:372 length:201 start_codon:yes stop_codon:yes gene_type:complete
MEERTLQDRINEARQEASRFLVKVALYEAAEKEAARHWGFSERAALKRSALDCGNAMRQINKRNYN